MSSSFRTSIEILVQSALARKKPRCKFDDCILELADRMTPDEIVARFVDRGLRVFETTALWDGGETVRLEGRMPTESVDDPDEP